MPYRDSKIEGGRVRLKTSPIAGETIGAGGLSTGELALNSADGVLHFRTASGGAGLFPSASGVSRIVVLTQAAYDALATKVSDTLYVIT